ncbi:MAG: cytochrome c oxidase assembly protein, partial [Mesorhizobium sp.]
MSFEAFFSTSICYGAGAPETGWTLALPITLPLAALALVYAT